MKLTCTRGGFSLLEAVLSCFLMTILTVVCFVALRGGMWASQRGASQAEAVQDVQSMLAVLTAYLQSASLPSLTIGPGNTSFAVLDNAPQNGPRSYDASGRVVWERYDIVYYDAPAKVLRARYLPLTSTASERQTPGPLDQYDPGGGAQPLASYLNSGQVIGRNLLSCQFSRQGGRVALTLHCEKKGPRNGVEKVETTTSVMLRN